MLKRNKVLVAFMLVAVLCMAIGFAAISDTLYVSGTAGLSIEDGSAFDEEFEKNVYFVDAMAVAGNVSVSKIESDEDGDEKDKYTFAIDAAAFNKVGATQAVTVWVQNNNNIAANLKVSTVEEGTLADYIEVTPKLDTTSVAAGAKTQLTITVELKKVPTSTATSSISFTIDATPGE